MCGPIKVPLNDQHNCMAIQAFRRVSPTDMPLHSAHLPDEDHMNDLLANGVIAEQESKFRPVLFKCPRTEADDRLGPKGLNTMTFRDEAVKTEMNEFQAAAIDDFCCTLCLVDLGGRSFENQAFSMHESIVQRFESTPDPCEVPWGEETLNCHAHWCIATKNTTVSAKDEEKETWEEQMMKKKASKVNGAKSKGKRWQNRGAQKQLCDAKRLCFVVFLV